MVELAAPEDTAALVALVRDGQREIALVEGLALPDELATHDLVTQRLVVVLRPGTARRRARLLVEELERVPLVAAPPGTSSRRLLDEAFAAVGLSPLVVVVAAQREAILPLVLAGAGAALVPEPWLDRPPVSVPSSLPRARRSPATSSSPTGPGRWPPPPSGSSNSRSASLGVLPGHFHRRWPGMAASRCGSPAAAASAALQVVYPPSGCAHYA